MQNEDEQEEIEMYPVYAAGKDMPEIKGYVEISTGKTYWEQLDDGEWLYVGHVRHPKNKVQWFWHDFFHGLAMGYPLWDVVVFAVTHLTKRALDGGDSAPLQALSTPGVLSPSPSDSASRPAAQ